MMKRILLAVDGTASGKAAQSFALRLAQRCNTMVSGLAVLDIATFAGPEAVPAGGSTYKARRDERHLAAARAYIEQALSAFSGSATKLGLKSDTHLMTDDPALTIAAEADINDLIVLGRTTTFDQGHEDSGMQIVTQLLSIAPRPVVVSPDELAADGDVLVAFDGSIPAVRALQLFALLGSAWRDKMIIVVSIDEASVKAKRLASRAADYLTTHGYRVTPKPIASSRAPSGLILDIAKEVKAGLIVQGAYGHRTWLDFLLGSTTTVMLKEAKVPLFMSH